MTNLDELIKEVDKLALEEIQKYSLPAPFHYEISNLKGQEIAKKLKADEDVVALGTRLMDIKIGEAIKQNRLQDHVKMSAEYAKEIISKYKIENELIDKIINCVEAHHKQVPFTSIESEICANADCYRFLNPKVAIHFFANLQKRDMDFDESVKYFESKVDEKWKILSLDICKKELTPSYKLLKKIISELK